MVIGEFGRCFQLSAGLIEKLLGLFRVSTQLIFVGALRFVDLFIRLQDVMLSLGKIRVLAGINIGLGSLRKRDTDER
jgi:hypothetical protein